MLPWLACVLTLQAPRKHHLCRLHLPPQPDIERTLIALPVLNYKITMIPHTHTLLCIHAYIDNATAVYVVTHRALG